MFKMFINIVSKNKFKFLKQKQNGSSIIFFVLFVIPILSFLFMITFDVASIYTSKRKVQYILDEASLQGVKFFPYKDYSKNITKRYLENAGLDSNYFQITVDESGIKIVYNREYELAFSSLTKYLVGSNAKIAYPVSAFSYATPSVNDVLLLLDRNPYNSPSEKEYLWGDDGSWPAANYFNMDSERFSDARYYTEQCFNDVFLPLKKMLIDTYNFFGSIGLNSVGVGVFPAGAYKKDFEILKEISRVNFSSNESNFLIYTASDGFSSIDCYFASQKEQQEEKYKIPLVNSDYKIDNKINYEEVEKIINESKSSLQTTIWSTPAHKGVYADFKNVLDYSIKSLISTSTRDDRRTSSEYIRKNIFIFSSNLPNNGHDFFPDSKVKIDIENVVSILENVISSNKVEINIVYVLYKTDKALNLTNIKIDSFKNFLNNTLNKHNKFIKFYLITKDTEEELIDNLHDFIWLNKKEGSLWR